MRRNRWWAFSAAAFLASSATASAQPAQEAGAEAVIRGTVVDEAGKPVAGALVDLLGWDVRSGDFSRLTIIRTGPVPTGPDGGFLLRPDGRVPSVATVRASADGGERLAVATVRPQDLAPVEPVRLVLKPSRPVTVRVADAAGKPVAAAAVEVMARQVAVTNAMGVVDPGTTDEPRGRPVPRPGRYGVPRDPGGAKDGVGVDWLLNGVAEPPAEVSLTLRGTRTITLRALDSGGLPIPGVVFRLDGLTLRGGPMLRSVPRITAATTDASGVARWRWVPEECWADLRIDFLEEFIEDIPPTSPRSPRGDLTLSVRFRRRARLSGRVVHADGSPARGVMLHAKGLGPIPDGSSITFRSGEDGSYSITARPDRAYLIAVTERGLATAPIQDIFIGEGEHHGGLNFRLIEGTRLHGRVASGQGVQARVVVNLLGEELPPDQRQNPGEKERLRIPIPAATPDARGDYEVRLGPGEYEVYSTSHRDRPTIHVDGTGEFALNFLGDTIPPPKSLTGVVVEADPGGAERPVKGAAIQVASGEGGGGASATADEAGRFTVRRSDRDIGLYAYSGEKVAGMKVAKEVDEVKVVLGPSATASGRVVDASGRPFIGEGPFMTTLGGTDGLPGLSGTRYTSKFQPGGRYTFKSLIPGVEYKVSFLLFRDSGARDNIPIKTFRVPGPGPIDLGEFVVPAERP